MWEAFRDHLEVLWGALVALGIVVALTPAVGGMARLLGVVDNPGGRRINRRPIPRLGGLAMFMGFLVPALAFLDLTPEARGILLGAAIASTERLIFNDRLDAALTAFFLIVSQRLLTNLGGLLALRMKPTRPPRKSPKLKRSPSCAPSIPTCRSSPPRSICSRSSAAISVMGVILSVVGVSLTGESMA